MKHKIAYKRLIKQGMTDKQAKEIIAHILSCGGSPFVITKETKAVDLLRMKQAVDEVLERYSPSEAMMIEPNECQIAEAKDKLGTITMPTWAINIYRKEN